MLGSAPEVAHEDLVALHPWLMLQHHYENARQEDIRVLRQCSVGPRDRADLLLVHRRGLTVVELKRDRITQMDVGQALRYAGLARRALSRDERLARHDLCVEAVLAAPSVERDALCSSLVESNPHPYHDCGCWRDLPLHFYQIGHGVSARRVELPIDIIVSAAERRLQDAVYCEASQLWSALCAR